MLAVIGVLTALSVPAYDLLVRRAKADEAHAFLAAIVHAEHRHFRDTGHYLPCGWSDEAAGECWEKLAVGVNAQLAYRYRVTLTGDSFTVEAKGDLDGDGEFSDYSLDGRTQKLTMKKALE